MPLSESSFYSRHGLACTSIGVIVLLLFVVSLNRCEIHTKQKGRSKDFERVDTPPFPLESSFGQSEVSNGKVVWYMPYTVPLFSRAGMTKEIPIVIEQQPDGSFLLTGPQKDTFVIKATAAQR